MTIGSAQVKSFFGIRSGSTSDFLVSIESFFTYITETRWADTLLGLFSLITLLVVKVSQFFQMPLTDGIANITC